MVDADPDDWRPTDLDRIARSPEVAREGWVRTIEDAQAMMADREDDGYETLLLPAGDTTPKSPDAGDTDEWGLSYIVPGNRADQFESFAEGVDLVETAVYQSRQGDNVFVVTEWTDREATRALFVAGVYRIRFSPQLVRTAMAEGKMYTHLKRLDGTLVRTFEHDHPEWFFPNPDEFYAHDTSDMYDGE